jgi:hypothetical protein
MKTRRKRKMARPRQKIIATEFCPKCRHEKLVADPCPKCTWTRFPEGRRDSSKTPKKGVVSSAWEKLRRNAMVNGGLMGTVFRPFTGGSPGSSRKK